MLRQLLDEIVDAFDAGDLAQLGKFLSDVRRNRSSQSESQERSLPSGEQIRTDVKDIITVRGSIILVPFQAVADDDMTI